MTACGKQAFAGEEMESRSCSNLKLKTLTLPSPSNGEGIRGGEGI